MSDEDTQQVAVRFPTHLLEAMDARAAATGRSRHAWIIQAISYILTELPAGATTEQRRNARAAWDDQQL